MTGGWSPGLQDSYYGVIVKVADFFTPLRIAVTFAVAWKVMELVVMLKVAVLEPLDTVTLVGTVAYWVLLLVRVTTVSLMAGAVKVTVPVALWPPWTLVGLKVRLFRVGGKTVKVKALEVPPPGAGLTTVML